LTERTDKERAMHRATNWKVLAVVVALTLVAAAICLVIGDTNLASVLIVGAVLEGGVYAILLAVASVIRKRHDSRVIGS
jgi:hypothetical protein